MEGERWRLGRSATVRRGPALIVADDASVRLVCAVDLEPKACRCSKLQMDLMRSNRRAANVRISFLNDVTMPVTRALNASWRSMGVMMTNVLVDPASQAAPLTVSKAFPKR